MFDFNYLNKNDYINLYDYYNILLLYLIKKNYNYVLKCYSKDILSYWSNFSARRLSSFLDPMSNKPPL